MSYVLGLDVGTSTTAAAVGRPGRVGLVALDGDRPTAPTVAALTESGAVVVGAAADLSSLPPDRVARSFKRVLGDPVLLSLGPQRVMPEQLLSHVIEGAVARAVAQEGEWPALVVVTHPVGYGPFKKDLLDEACLAAGISSILLMSEAEAAVANDAARSPYEVGETALVYDFGGGLFSASLVRRTPRGVDVLGAPESITRLGGIDFDGIVLGLVDEALGRRLGRLAVHDPAVAVGYQTLLRQCRLAKEALSQQAEAVVPVRLPGLVDDVVVGRPSFERAIRSRVEETVSTVQRVLMSAGLRPEAVSRVLLMGGSSNIPLVQQLVGEAMGRRVEVDREPKLGVALGAALLGRDDRSRTITFSRLTETAGGALVAAAAAGSAPALANSRSRSTLGAVLVGTAAVLTGLGVAALVTGEPPGPPTVAGVSVAPAGPTVSVPVTPATRTGSTLVSDPEISVVRPGPGLGRPGDTTVTVFVTLPRPGAPTTVPPATPTIPLPTVPGAPATTAPPRGEPPETTAAGGTGVPSTIPSPTAPREGTSEQPETGGVVLPSPGTAPPTTAPRPTTTGAGPTLPVITVPTTVRPTTTVPTTSATAPPTPPPTTAAEVQAAPSATQATIKAS